MSRVIGASGSAMSALAAAESSSRVVARPCMRGCCCAVGAASLSRHLAFARCAVVKGACAATVRTVSSPCSLVRASVRRGCAPGQHGTHCVGALGADGEATGRCTRGCGVRLRGPWPARHQGVCAKRARGPLEAVAMVLVGGLSRHRARLVAGRAAASTTSASVAATTCSVCPRVSGIIHSRVHCDGFELALRRAPVDAVSFGRRQGTVLPLRRRLPRRSEAARIVPTPGYSRLDPCRARLRPPGATGLREVVARVRRPSRGRAGYLRDSARRA